MAYGRTSPYIGTLAPDEHAGLERWLRAPTRQAGLAQRAQGLRLRAVGHSLSALAQRLALGRRLLVHHTRTPWRLPAWRAPTGPHAAECSTPGTDRIALYSRRLRKVEVY